MNEPVRRLSVVILVMFLALMIAASWIQVLTASSLNADSRNVRTLYREFGNFRGPFVVDGESVVFSKPVDDPFNFQRTYTNGELYASATGYYSIVFGKTALEQTENSLLAGTSDALFWNRLQDLFSGREQQGASIELTLRAALQQTAAEALGDQKGAVVALDPKTGKILAMVTSPTFDPALLASHDTQEVNDAYAELNEDPDGPLVNRAIAGDTYPPGSTFKLIVAAAALDAGYSPDSTVYAPDELPLPGSTKSIQNYGGESCGKSEQITLEAALTVSCNTAFADLGMTLGWDAVRDKAIEFGWTDTFRVPLVVTPSRLPLDPDDAQVAMSSIGQFDVRATPMQMAMVTAAIANNGRLMTPYLVDTARASDLSVIDRTSPELYGNPLTVNESSQLTQMMISVVENGTGKAAQIPGVTVAGKTGTAETGTGAAPHAWFVGFAPAENPVVAVAVIVENGGSMGSEATGGKIAAPIAKKVMQKAIELDKEDQ
ncbi:peptidoglycan D,D-transpeptidase FtsI family protein [Demequina sp.]|uniref:peptidoglycan D,D-transpeptidase FtsI family protein n=1 Tax=Demequina sp. TaxID=2050685 RepID=UPI003D09D728